MKEAILIGGANGAGKTTLARQLLPIEHPQVVFLNADEIQREATEIQHPVRAARELLRRLEVHVARGDSFMLETTLASDAHARRIPKWHQQGYRVILYFIELPSPDLAVARVAHRVAKGGHHVPETDVRRRFQRGLNNFENVFKPIVDEWYHWRSDEQALSLVDCGLV